MDQLFCDMGPTGRAHDRVPGLNRYCCKRPDCRRETWSYTSNIMLPCRHRRTWFERAGLTIRRLLSRKPRRKTQRQPKPKSNVPKPTLTTMLWDLAKSLKAYAKDRRHVSPEAYQKRLEVCQGCELRDDTSCKLCGCQVDLKALAVAWHCPAFKWEGDVGPDQVVCAVILTHEAEKQRLVEMIQSSASPKDLIVIDCIGTYVQLENERVIVAPNWLTGMSRLPKAHAYAFVRPHARGVNLIGGMLWVQQISGAGVVMPVYDSVRQTMTNSKQKPQHWRPIPAVTGDAFLITAATVDRLGWPCACADLDWALQSYSLDARMAGIVVGEAWSCGQRQPIPTLGTMPLQLRGTLESHFGRYWDMLLTDSRVRNVLPSTPPVE